MVEEFFLVSSLPMRNWNQAYSAYRVWLPEYPAYLWGIETWDGQYVLGAIPRYPAYLWGIETYGTGIFKIRYDGYPAYLWGIETRSDKVNGCSPLSVSSLPMRNWNTSTSPLLLNAEIVSSLPMRNWNGCYVIYVRPGERVSSLPMRNWNRKPVWKKTTTRFCIQPTYEELKHVQATEQKNKK